MPELTRSKSQLYQPLHQWPLYQELLLNRAILDGYGKQAHGRGRFPLAVIHIHIDPYLADVNVHPDQARSADFKERELMALLSEAISNSLKEQALIPDALENLAKSTVRNRQKGRADHSPTQRKYALL